LAAYSAAAALILVQRLLFSGHFAHPAMQDETLLGSPMFSAAILSAATVAVLAYFWRPFGPKRRWPTLLFLGGSVLTMTLFFLAYVLTSDW
jgi:drug/metabolite transporter (DMT)-like permease